ncbi:hypothetical protein C6P61_00545 [Malikia spinosa]|uniref:Uncharacterized protein n=1 Tax=Malikia spinosa TaxID=86180 RepID=A0A2S9KJ93_9BURK|nr:MAG: hypothetical protein A2486_16565 [Burkholderiales bacterium RIFOXYC12_FULL_65_23]PRD70486.1 hypothetical protein C6P61_00545 [Malikia spinosa]
MSYTTTYCITGSSRSILLEIQRDDALMVRIHQGWEAFQVHLDQDAPPALRDEDTMQRTNADWLPAD